MEPEDASIERLDRLDGLTRFLARTSIRPSMPSPQDYRDMTGVERIAFNELRHRHVVDDILVKTEAVMSVVKATRRTISVNRGKTSGRRGVIVSGEPFMGKTTAVHAAMRATFNQFQREFPDWAQQSYHPVVSVEAKPAASGKSVMREFAEFFGLPERHVDTMQSLMNTVAHLLQQSRTRLVVIDEVNRIAPKSAGNGEGVDLLKSLSEAVPATFVYVGLNIHEGDLLDGIRGRQIDERTTTKVLRPFEIGNNSQWELWNGMIRTFESHLLLFNHEVGTLAGLSQHLHAITEGRIGRLANLFQLAVDELLYREVDPSDETITGELLEEMAEDLWGEKKFANSPSELIR